MNSPYRHWGAIALGLGLALAACEKGPAGDVAERIDRRAQALGKGRAESAGGRTGQAVEGPAQVTPGAPGR